MSRQGWGAGAPIFRVRDLKASRDYYVNVLGFTVDWEFPPIVSVSRDRCCIFLCADDQSCARVWVWIGVPDAGALHDELRAKGAIIRHPPTRYEWAYEMQGADPDGNVLRIGSDPQEGDRGGEWLDASGRLWKKGSAGDWLRVR